MPDHPSTMLATPDECLRCGYDLRGIDSAQACPECGLLAERSRRVTDELHDTRPRWLRKLSLGVGLMLLAILAVWAWGALLQRSFDLIGNQWAWRSRPYYQIMYYIVPLIGVDVAAILLLAGAILLTTPEGYPLADQADARFRKLVRIAASIPLVALLFYHYQAVLDMYSGPNYWDERPWRPPEIAAVLLASVGCLPLPVLIFMRLRGLAKRARSAHLAEHCLIVGIGTSAALVFVSIAALVLYNGDEWFSTHWSSRSSVSLGLQVALWTLALLFALWSLYLLVRFAIAFQIAARALRKKWRADDRAATA